MQNLARALVAALVLFATLPLTHVHAADSPSAIGLWKTFDDHTGKARSLVRIYANGEHFFGRIEKILPPGDQSKLCSLCTDERKNQPVLGLVIMRNLKMEMGTYTGGDILDPDSGTVYRCKLQLDGDGTRLTVRGYVGISLFGRSQVWQRVE